MTEWMNRDDAIALWRASPRYCEQKARDDAMWRRHAQELQAGERAERIAAAKEAERSRRVVNCLALGIPLLIVLIWVLV